MAQTLGTDSVNNDLYLGPDGNIALLSGLAAVEAACATASKAQLGEMVLATNAGLPNFETIWIGVPNFSLWRQYLINTLENVEGVTQVKDVTLSADNGVLSYQATIETQFGTGMING